MIQIHPRIMLDETRVTERFVAAPGPGGQHVNKNATAVQIRVPLDALEMPDAMRGRLVDLAGGRLSRDDVLIIEARDHRSQHRNRADAWTKLSALLRRAAFQPETRRATKPSRGAKKKRLADKRRRAGVKAMRGKVNRDDD